MALEQTLSLIKPDAVERNLAASINLMIEEAGLKVITQKHLTLTRQQAELFYSEHKEKEFFGSLVQFMTSGPIIAQILEGENAINIYRDLIGSTDPKKAKKGTIRASFAINFRYNSVHGSDSLESSQREIAFFFSDHNR